MSYGFKVKHYKDTEKPIRNSSHITKIRPYELFYSIFMPFATQKH